MILRFTSFLSSDIKTFDFVIIIISCITFSNIITNRGRTSLNLISQSKLFISWQILAETMDILH